jgi:hypothetical protein
MTAPTTIDVTNMRIDGGWVLMPKLAMDDVMYFYREGNELVEKMLLTKWANLPIYGQHK